MLGYLQKKIIKLYRENPYITLPIYMATRPNGFNETYTFLKNSESWSEERMLEWQFKQIKNIVEYAYKNVPFYNRVYSSVGFEIGDLKSMADFELLPYVTKDDIKKNKKDFVSKDAQNMNYVKIHTGGSTDKPMEFFIDRSMNARENAFFYYYWEKYGYKAGEKCIILRGHKVADLRKKIFYKYDRISNYKIFDSDYISDIKYIKYYDKQLKGFKAKVIQAYPSSLYTLAKIYEASGFEPPSFELVFLGSENTYDDQIEYIKKIFKAKTVMYHYGHSEQVLLALKYADANSLGFMPQYGYMELIDSNNSCIKEEGRLGEIVGTGFSKVMPFIRYKTGDCASYSNYKSNDFMKFCRSVERIEGRLHEFVVTKEGRLVSLCSIAGAHIEEFSFVSDMQYEQNEIGKLLIKVTSYDGGETLTMQHTRAIKQALENKFNNTMDVEITQVDEIQRTKMGKKVMLKQELNIDDFRKKL